jgi:ABC-type polysaccharide/polyol phosphate transport system ATPase subunit
VTAGAAIEVAGLCKTFRLPREQTNTIKERFLHPLRRTVYEENRALRDVTFTIRQGEFFGVIGPNGSGKSTLLKILAGIYQPSSGVVRIEGDVSPFIELGVGFNPDLTARDNVTINAIMLGLTRQQAKDRFDEIVAFAELEDFLDLRLKNYSSGMTVRLAFSIAIQVDAEILLIDEVLAVGDATFQQKCFDEFHRLKREGKTILFVTHDMGDVQRFCDRAMLMDKGKVIDIGDPASVAKRYNEINFGRMRVAAGEREALAGPRGGTRDADILDTWFEDRDGDRVAVIAQGDPCCACMEVLFNQALVDPIFGVDLRNDAGHTVFATSTASEHGATGDFAAGEKTVVKMRFENWLTAGRYTLTPSVARNGRGDDVIDVREDVASLVVHGEHGQAGMARFPHGFELERAPATSGTAAQHR